VGNQTQLANLLGRTRVLMYDDVGKGGANTTASYIYDGDEQFANACNYVYDGIDSRRSLAVRCIGSRC
jgi:hypothetical protein